MTTAQGIFITGSGTGVGKTYVTTLLLSGFSKLGVSATYMKPVETGCADTDAPQSGNNAPLGPDTLRALGFVSRKTEIDLHSPYRFAAACSPHLAARESGRDIRMERIVSAYENLRKNTAADITLVEGAGGALVPTGNGKYMADIIKALGIPAILVADPGLGTLNHTFMSLRVLEQCGIPVIGVIINNARGIERDFIYEDNVKTIREHVRPVPCLDIGHDVALSMLNDDYDERVTEFCGQIISPAGAPTRFLY